MTQQPSVEVKGVVRASIDKTWELYRSFGDIQKWWPIYEWVKLDPPGQDKVGAIRRFLTKTGRTYAERLTVRDDQAHHLEYELVSLEPAVPGLGTIKTSITMQKDGDHTAVTWSSFVEANALVKGTVESTQESVYRAAIGYLDTYFNPQLGSIRVGLVQAKNLSNKSLLPLDPYVTARLDGGTEVKSRVRRFQSNPRFDESLELAVLSPSGRLTLSVIDANLGRDTVLGVAELDLHNLKNGQQERRTLLLEPEREASLEVELELSLQSGEELPPTALQMQAERYRHARRIIEQLQDQAVTTARYLAAPPQKIYDYARYPRLPQLPDVDLENLPRMVDGLPSNEALPPTKIGRITERAVQYLYSESGFLQRAQEQASPYEAAFDRYMKRPDYVADHWKNDDEFGRQCIQGLNPMVIELVSDIERLPVGFKTLTIQGESLGALIKEKRLFWLDYTLMKDIKPYLNMYVYAPSVLLAKVNTPEGDKLTVAAIQLERGEDAPIYTAEKTPPNRWLLAKIHAACADNQIHQFVWHLGVAHLATEPLVIAWHNTVPEDHFLRDVLRTHFSETIGINFLARQTLVSQEVPFTDRTFSPGTAQALMLFREAWKNYDFQEWSFPRQLERRGFDEAGSDGLKDFYYRDDGFLLWNALGKYIRAAVTAEYPGGDSAVKNDSVVQTWAKECSSPDKADIPGFPNNIDSVDQFVTTLQTIIWNCSALHSAVNFPQYEFLSFVPNRPDSLFEPMPPGMNEIESTLIQRALPGPLILHFQLSFAWLLTTPSSNPLSGIESMKKRHPAAHKVLVDELNQVTSAIEERNRKLQETSRPTYPWLLPSEVAASVDI